VLELIARTAEESILHKVYSKTFTANLEVQYILKKMMLTKSNMTSMENIK